MHTCESMRRASSPSSRRICSMSWRKPCSVSPMHVVRRNSTPAWVASRQKRRYSLEQILVGRRTLTPEQLTKAKNYANSLNIELRDAVIQQKMSDADSVMQAYAESIGLPYIDLGDIGVDLVLVPQI